MSEVKRYRFIDNNGYPATKVVDTVIAERFVCGSDYDAAQSELSALRAEVEELNKTTGAAMFLTLTSELSAPREELAQSRVLVADQALNLKRVKREYESMRDRKNSIIDLQRRLTAAEQRNADLVEIITEVAKQAGDHHMSHQTWNLKTHLANIHQKLEAALKPTESGASE